MLGFKTNEIMVGTHHFIVEGMPEGEFPMYFHISWGNKSLLRWLNPLGGEFLLNKAEGHITVGNLVEKADCYGSLELLYFTERKIRYILDFRDRNERPYRYIGEKINLWPWNLYKTHFICYGQIKDIEQNRIISKSKLYFPYREIASFILSTKLTYSDKTGYSVYS